MKQSFSLFLFLTAWCSGAIAQHLSIDIPLELPATHGEEWQQRIHLAGMPIHDFAAVSVVVEADGLNRDNIQCSLTTSNMVQDVPPFGEEAVQGRYVSELIFVPEKDARDMVFHFRLNKEVGALKARLHVFSPTGEATADAQPPAVIEPHQNMLCSCPQPDFVPRASWGAAFGLNGNIYTPPAVYTTVTHLIVHHSAGTNTSNNWAAVVAAIFDYHVNTNGWADIGYNWLVAPNGQLFEGRGGGDNVRGSHMCGYNNNTMAVCALGNYVATPLPTAGIETIERLLAWKSCKENIAPIGNGPINSHTGNMQNISGHRDGCAPGYTACPGDMLYGQLAGLQQGVVGYSQAVCQSVSTYETLSSFSMALSPNPVTDHLLVRFSGAQDGFQLRVLDSFGRQVNVARVAVGEGSMELAVGHLVPGVYFVVADLDGRRSIGRFLKL